MQRQAGTSRVAELPQTSQPRPQLFSPKGIPEEADELPVYKRNSAVAKKENFKSRLQEKLVHLIPVVVILSFFILWWFSYPESLFTHKENEKIATFADLFKENSLYD